jgi:hypothetical protein
MRYLITGGVPGLLGDPCRIGVSGHPGDPDPPAAGFDDEQHLKRLNKTVSTWKKSVATTPDAWVRKNSHQVGPLRREAGPGP